MAPVTNTEIEPPREALGVADWPGESEVSLLDVLATLAGRKRLIAGVALIGMAISAVVGFVLPPSYTAEAVILPPQPEQSSQSMLMGPFAGLSGLGGLAGAGAASGLLRNPADVYIGVLKSRTIADHLIAKFQLQQLYGCKNLTDTRSRLARQTSITTGKDSLIRIQVDDYERTRAARMANAYVDELHQQNSRLALTSASQRRLFFEQQLVGEKNALADAEIALKNMQQTGGLVFPRASPKPSSAPWRNFALRSRAARCSCKACACTRPAGIRRFSCWSAGWRRSTSNCRSSRRATRRTAAWS